MLKSIAFILVSLVAFLTELNNESTESFEIVRGQNERVVAVIVDLSPKFKKSERTLFHIKIINSLNDTIKYFGDAINQPYWRQQKLVNGEWEEVDVGWFCWNNRKQRSLDPLAGTLVNVVSVNPTKNIRVGIDYSINSDTTMFTRWSQSFSLPD